MVFITTLIVALVLAFVWTQFRGTFTDETRLTMLSPRSGLSMDPGSKVTYNGVEIGKVADVTAVSKDSAVSSGDAPQARIVLDVEPRYIDLIPQNVTAEIKA